MRFVVRNVFLGFGMLTLPPKPTQSPLRPITPVRALGVVWALMLALAPARAQVVDLAYDGFNYAAGALTGRSGGTGWSTGWIRDYGSGATFNVNATGLTYAGLTTTGGRLEWGSGGNGISENSRTLPLVDDGVVYIQFLAQFGSSSGGGTPNLRLYKEGALTGGIGGNGGTFGGVFSILDTTLSPASNGSSSSSTSLSTLSLVVTRIDYVNQSTSLYLNPNLATFNYLNPGTPQATFAGLAPAFDQIALYSRSPASFDELRVISAVPEPAKVMPFVAGVLALWGWVRRTR